jgi:GT2 family glycosyltransferase/glycosyltransferase involved in cell wall biosynthesis
VEITHSAPVRICIFGAAPPAAEWLSSVVASVPANIHAQTFTASSAAAALRAAAAAFPGDNLVLLRAGTLLPPWWYARLIRTLTLPDILVASPLDNVDTTRSPLPPGVQSDAEPRAIDALCYACGEHVAIDWPSFSALLSAWNGTALQGLDLENIRDCTLPAQFAPQRGTLLDHLYVADPAQALRGPPLPRPGADPLPVSALGQLRERVATALPRAAEKVDFYPGLDTKPVVLHILHGWGGGAERFVRDLAGVDQERHHLVLTARGNFDRRRYGEVLELYDDALTQPPLRQLHLSDPIASTSFGHRNYAAFLAEVIAAYGVTCVVVSSLIGHSLDALRTGLPTIYFVHDFYPLWPLLHRNLDDANITFDAAQLSADLARADAGFEFAERDPAYWLALREALCDAALSARAHLIAPSRAAMAIFLRLQPRLSTLPQKVVAHGMEQWPAAHALPAPASRERLRLIVLGRVRRGKASHLLRATLAGLREHAEIFLLGAGPESREFFGERDVHILLNYRRDELPALLARVAPDAALILPDFAETFSYTLSELAAFAIPAIATRLGALGERIRDGVDGVLMAPEPAAIVAAVARLRADRGALVAARSALAKVPQRTLVDMAQDYRDLLPRSAQPIARYALSLPSADRLRAQTLADELGASRRHGEALQAKAIAQQSELGKRAEWAMGLEVQVKRGATALQTLRGEFDERSAWALKLNAELDTLRPLYESTRSERDQILGSLSWRITKPLRFAKRKLRALRARLAFASSRLRAAIHRTRGSLASRGVAGTLRRAADEFRRNPVLPQPLVVAPPSDVFAPFALPTSTQPRVSIIIPVYNKFAYTAACLRSLAEHAGSVPFEVVVVDDGSSDATPQRLAEISGIRAVRNAENLGFVGSCNAGAECATGEFVVFLNNDTVVTAGWLDALLRCFEQEPDCGLVGAKLVYPDGRLQEAGGIVFADGSGWNYGRFDDPADPRYNFRREADYCSGAAILMRRDLFVQLGGFDARYAPAYYEDTDLAFAVRAAGKKVFYEPRSMVIHFEGVTAGTDTGSGMKRFQVVNRDKFLHKWTNELARQPAAIASAAKAYVAANWRARGRVLIIDACTPMPDHDSGSLRMVNLMRLLREMGLAVSFLPDNRAYDGGYTQALQALGVEALYHPFVSDPIAWLREHGRDVDAIVLSRHYVAANYVGLARLYAPQAKLIFDTVDLHYLREQRAAQLEGKPELAQQSSRTQAQEFKLMRECDVSLVVSSVEKDLLARDLPQARIEILSNVHEIYGRRREFAARRELVFVGGFQHPPNTDAVLWFVREVFPLLRAELPDVVFHVIGSKAPPQILDLAHDGVVVHGFVADIAPFMDGCRLSIAPLRYGAGVKGKVNMAMSYGLPVVATPTAVEGMHVVSGEDILVAQLPADFAGAIRRAYGDAALWKKLSDNGLANVRQHFSFDSARAALKRILPPSIWTQQASDRQM